MTGGNLSNHLEVLERAGHVATQDAFVRLRPARVVTLTESGRVAFEQYIRDLEDLVSELRRAMPAKASGNRVDSSSAAKGPPG